MHRRLTHSRRSPLLLSLLLLTVAVRTAFPAPLLQVEFDGREFHRQLIHTKLEIPVQPGPLHLWYPKWIPGIHAPYGPVQNLAGLRLETPDGMTLPWTRDPEQLHRVTCDVPAGANRVIAKLDYICNQPSANSKGIDSYGGALLGVVNWNTCLLYPEGVSIDDLKVQMRIRLPSGWRFGTALREERKDGDWTVFRPETFRTVIDSPLICGERFKTITLPTKDTPPTFLHLTSESQSAIEFSDALIGGFGRLMNEANALFGAVHFDEYHFLLVCSDPVPTIGLEHLSSSLNAVNERDMVEGEKRFDWPVYLLPHELVHSWCGKYRRPAGMWTTDYHTPKQTSLLWIYEGLTQYLGELLTVRSGLVDLDEYLGRLAYTVNYLSRQEGRQWRSLEDTATAAYQLRAPSPSWGNLRRSQDYYNEGLLFWLEVDLLIRRESDGQRSLDDFCRQFMGPPNTAGIIKPYELDEVIGILNQLATKDWRRFIHERIQTPQDRLPLEWVDLAGYRLEYATEPTPFLARRLKDRKQVFALDSLGLTASNSGEIDTVVPGSPADQAALAPGIVIAGVNGMKYTSQRLRDAIADSVANRTVDLLILESDRFATKSLSYDGGLRYLKLARNPDKPDRLRQLFSSRTTP